MPMASAYATLDILLPWWETFLTAFAICLQLKKLPLLGKLHLMFAALSDPLKIPTLAIAHAPLEIWQSLINTNFTV